MGNPTTDKRERGGESRIKVAALQVHPQVGDKQRNVAGSLRMIHDAARQGVTLMVLPELCNTGYVFNSRGECFALAEKVPGGATTEAWAGAARDLGVYVCAGIAEREGRRLYNSAVLIGPEGHVGTYRKTHLWNEEKLWFEPGDLGYPVFELPFGRVGMRICYDVWFPEVSRILAAQGADIICDPTNWVNVPPLQTKEKPTAAYSAQQMSLMNSVFAICADRVGEERGCLFIGNSCVVDPTGGFVAGPASAEEPALVIAEINVSQARYRHWSEFNDPMTDRRTDLYDAYLGYLPGNPAGRDR
ncbi:MAG: hydratase [Deltaproteobacteria bacterium]|nr:hydratase [Deltaproteobacteria bacterium]